MQQYLNVAIIAKELVVNVYKELSIQNVIIIVEEIYLVAMYVNRNVQQNVYAMNLVQISVPMDTVLKSVVKFVLIVQRNAISNASIRNVPNYVENYATGNLVMKDAKKNGMWPSMLWFMWGKMSRCL